MIGDAGAGFRAAVPSAISSRHRGVQKRADVVVVEPRSPGRAISFWLIGDAARRAARDIRRTPPAGSASRFRRSVSRCSSAAPIAPSGAAPRHRSRSRRAHGPHAARGPAQPPTCAVSRSMPRRLLCAGQKSFSGQDGIVAMSEQMWKQYLHRLPLRSNRVDFRRARTSSHACAARVSCHSLRSVRGVSSLKRVDGVRGNTSRAVAHTFAGMPATGHFTCSRQRRARRTPGLAADAGYCCPAVALLAGVGDDPRTSRFFAARRDRRNANTMSRVSGDQSPLQSEYAEAGCSRGHCMVAACTDASV